MLLEAVAGVLARLLRMRTGALSPFDVWGKTGGHCTSFGYRKLIGSEKVRYFDRDGDPEGTNDGEMS